METIKIPANSLHPTGCLYPASSVICILFLFLSNNSLSSPCGQQSFTSYSIIKRQVSASVSLLNPLGLVTNSSGSSVTWPLSYLGILSWLTGLDRDHWSKLVEGFSSLSHFPVSWGHKTYTVGQSEFSCLNSHSKIPKCVLGLLYMGLWRLL